MAATGFVRVSTASHRTHIADPVANAHQTLEVLESVSDSNVVVFPELSLTGYTCGDLFAQDVLLESTVDALAELIGAAPVEQLVVVGIPVRVAGKLFNAAAAIFGGELIGVVPKQYLPNYQEFYEARWFAGADGSEPSSCDLIGGETCFEDVPFGIDLLIGLGELTVGIELCEDLWMPIPPSSMQATAGANLLLNLSASNELVGKADWREVLVRGQSGRCLAAYAYASAGPTESTTDLVFGGHCMIAENGALLAESHRVGQAGASWFDASVATADIDLQRLNHERAVTVSWQQASKRSAMQYRMVDLGVEVGSDGKNRRVAGRPFVPSDSSQLHRRCREIFAIQCAGLAKRISRLPDDMPLNIGVSGGLDSTLALLVAVKTCRDQGLPCERIHGLTMPGFGTTDRTLQSARQLMQFLSISAEEIDIQKLALETFVGLGHKPFGIELAELGLADFQSALRRVPAEQLQDLTFENVQARLRTMLLMSRGFVLGTGDLSEQALGWSTYNGDHMSMYNVNASIPKTLVKFLVQHVAQNEFDGPVRDCLMGVVETPISPELLPSGADGQMLQQTEQTIGPYELHDFFLYQMIRFGAGPRRILELAGLAEFSQPYSSDEIHATLRIFLARFFANQFKRSCVPDGPKVGSVSLSPRGDWRMPSDAEVSVWLKDMESEP